MGTIIILLLTKDMIVSGHNNSCWGTNVPGHKCVWAQTCLGTNVSEYHIIMSRHNRFWAQTCLGTKVSGHKRVWAQTCLGTNVSGHKLVWAQTCVGTVVWAQLCGPNHVAMGTNVVEPYKTRPLLYLN